MVRKFCNDCDQEITNINATHRNGKGDVVITGVFITFSDGLDYCDSCLLKKFTAVLS